MNIPKLHGYDACSHLNFRNIKYFDGGLESLRSECAKHCISSAIWVGGNRKHCIASPYSIIKCLRVIIAWICTGCKLKIIKMQTILDVTHNLQ